jgi:hypothetical protein
VKVPTVFEPVHFHLQFPDLLIELGLHLLVSFRFCRLAVRKNLRRAIEQLFSNASLN